MPFQSRRIVEVTLADMTSIWRVEQEYHRTPVEGEHVLGDALPREPVVLAQLRRPVVGPHVVLADGPPSDCDTGRNPRGSVPCVGPRRASDSTYVPDPS